MRTQKSTEMWPTGPLGQTHVDPHQMRMAHRRPSISSFGNSLEGFISLRRCVEPEQLSDLAFVSHNFADTTVVDGCVFLRGTSRSNGFIQWCTVICPYLHYEYHCTTIKGATLVTVLNCSTHQCHGCLFASGKGKAFPTACPARWGGFPQVLA